MITKIILSINKKCYSVFDRDVHTQKKATKGISQRTPLEHKEFIDALYKKREHRVTQTRFQMNKKTNQMELLSISKNSLNSSFTKRYIYPDKVRTRPLQKNGQFI